MKELVSFIVKSIVEFPDKVTIEEGENEKGKVLKLTVAERQTGKNCKIYTFYFSCSFC